MEIKKEKKGYLLRIVFNTWIYFGFIFLIIFKLSEFGLTGLLIFIIPLIILTIIILMRIKHQKNYLYELKIFDNILFIKYIEKGKDKTLRIDAEKLTSKVVPIFPVKGRWILKIYEANILILCQTNDFDWKYDDLKDVENKINQSQ